MWVWAFDEEYVYRNPKDITYRAYFYNKDGLYEVQFLKTTHYLRFQSYELLDILFPL